jgi:hypothetical protein
MDTILDDKRTIAGLYFMDSDCTSYQAGSNGVSAIKAYGEPGQHCLLPYFAVYNCENNIISRIPAGMVQVVYDIKEG